MKRKEQLRGLNSRKINLKRFPLATYNKRQETKGVIESLQVRDEKATRGASILSFHGLRYCCSRFYRANRTI